MSDTERWIDDGERESVDTRGQYPKRGFPGALHSARRTAPSGASERDVLAVAREIHENDRDAAEAWRDRIQHSLAEYVGG